VKLLAKGFAPVRFSRAALAVLERHPWPGNVRELENLLERLAITVPDEEVPPEALPMRVPHSLAASDVSTVESEVATAGPRLVDVVPRTDAAAALRLELPREGVSLKAVLAAIEQDLIVQALQRSDGVVAHAARLLGVGRTTLLEKLRKRPGGADEFADA
jgi:sigma-54 specific flagellar transcriptional regulator A